jgi:hypothetical protein
VRNQAGRKVEDGEAQPLGYSSLQGSGEPGGMRQRRSPAGIASRRLIVAESGQSSRFARRERCLGRGNDG